jgi:hypothetical protein
VSTVRSTRRVNGVSLLLPLWEAACRRALAGFRRRLVLGPASNTLTLRRILRRHADSEFGRRHGFSELLREPDLETAWADALPVAEYDSFRSDIARMANGEPGILFPGRPGLFVSSSGTTGDPKLFPVTRRQQNAALSVIALLTPAARAACVPGLGFRQPTATLMVASRPGRQTAAGIPVGNPSGAGLRRMLSIAPPFWVFPPALLGVQDHPTALYLHALFALRARNLGCIEAIYCSHIVNWMALIERRGAELVRDIATGSLSADLVLSTAERAILSAAMKPDPQRAGEIERELARDSAGRMARLWPDLRVLSSVVSGPFAVSLPALRAMAGPGPAVYTTCFGATEGMIGINLWRDAPERYVMALGAVHFEFLPVSELDAPRPRCVRMDAVREGESYELVISNHAGLYRYRLGDVVRIVAFEGKTPVFEFEYRRGNVLDLVGEKTTEQHLRNAFARLIDETPGLQAGLTDFTLYGDISRVPYRYIVYVELDGSSPPVDAEAMAARLDVRLSGENLAYATLGRDNGRLAALELRLLPPGSFAQLLASQSEGAGAVNANQLKVPKLLRHPL